MSLAIELGKRIGALISSVSAQALYVYAFDTIAYPIESAGDDLAAWEKALKGITAGGGHVVRRRPRDSCGARSSTSSRSSWSPTRRRTRRRCSSRP